MKMAYSTCLATNRRHKNSATMDDKYDKEFSRLQQTGERLVRMKKRAADKLKKKALEEHFRLKKLASVVVEKVDCGIREEEKLLVYDISSRDIQPHRKSICSFRIETAREKQRGVFELKKKGMVIRRNLSRPFPSGFFKKKSTSIIKGKVFKVTLKKVDPSIALSEYFT